MTVAEHLKFKTAKKRKRNLLQERERSPSPKHKRKLDVESEDEPSENSDTCEEDPAVYLPMRFEQLTRKSDVRFYTGLPSTEGFRCLFDYLLSKAKNMQYWRGSKQTEKERPKDPTPFQQFAGGGRGSRTGPPRKLKLEEEFILTLMKLRLALLLEDLAFRFQISSGSASSTFITWVKLCSKELIVLIIWPSRHQIKKTLPGCFRKIYPKVRCIIDCFECFTAPPSGLDLAATMWSEYKHHYTFKVLVAITPNGEVSYVSPAHGGRATDIFIVKDSGFLNLLEPYDEVMADRGFEIREELMMRMSTLCIPQSKAAAMQMLPSDVGKTSSIANVRIYVEQAIRRMRVFHILKHELPIHLFSLADDIVRVCGALCNFLPPLAS